MKYLTITAALLSCSTLSFGNAFLPNIAGIDGWNSDSRNVQAGALQQGYLTLSNAKSPIINPAHAYYLNKQLTLNYSGTDDESINTNQSSNSFGGSLFVKYGDHSAGAYISRPTDDIENYQYPGTVPLDLDPTTAQVDILSNIIDLFWAKSFSFGIVGARINYRALTHTIQTSEDIDTTDIDKDSRSAHEYNLTAGFISNKFPIEATLMLGIPTLNFKDEFKDSAVHNIDTTEYDDRLKVASTVKYRLKQTDHYSLLVSGYAASNQSSLKTSDNNFDSIANYHINNKLNAGLNVSFTEQLTPIALFSSSLSYHYAKRTYGTRAVDTDTSSDNSIIDKQHSSLLNWVIGLQLSASEKTTFSGSLSSNIMDRIKTQDFGSDDTDDLTVNSTVIEVGKQANTTAQLGYGFKFSNGSMVNLLLNKELVSNGLNNGIASLASFTYQF